MKKENVIREKSFGFAVRVVNMYKVLAGERKEFVICKQLLRSGTSVGANIREALNAESNADFVHKLAIAQKECDETCFWLELLHKTEFINESEFNSIHQDASELLKIIRAIILSSKRHE
ncbi:MAG: four helix bundle protein [Odoribacteraceae bacterium]|jgi:four helix bundle protein|nr:four helix bundle protein [Odoribacteraceae bacterium]